MAEGIDDAPVPGRVVDHRQAVGKRGTKAHPPPAALPVETGQEAFGLVQQDVRAPIVRRKRQTAEFHRAADADAVTDPRDDKTVGGEGEVGFDVERRVRQGRVVAAFGLQRDTVSERRGQMMRPGAGGNNDPTGEKRSARRFDLDCVSSRKETLNTRLLEGGPARGKNRSKPRQPAARIADVDPVRSIAGMGEATVKTGLDLRDGLRAFQKIEADPVPAAKARE